MGMPGGFELVAILAVVLLLFGGKKIPELMKGLGTGIKNFKGAIKEDEVTDASSTAEVTSNSSKPIEKAANEESTAATPADTTKQA